MQAVKLYCCVLRKEREMKKLLIRLAGALFILASLAALILPTCIKVEEVSKKDFRECREEVTADLQTIENRLVAGLEWNNSPLKDDLKDNDLPSTKSSIKKRMKDAESLAKELVNPELSLKEVLSITGKAPKYIKDTENFLDTTYCADYVFEVSELMAYEHIEDAVDGISSLRGVFVVITAFFVIFAALGVASAVTHCFNKVRYLKYIFLVFLILIVVGMSVAVPALNDVLQDEVELERRFQDMTLRVTVMPYISVALMIIPVVLDIIFERKNKMKVEA